MDEDNLIWPPEEYFDEYHYHPHEYGDTPDPSELVTTDSEADQRGEPKNAFDDEDAQFERSISQSLIGAHASTREKKRVRVRRGSEGYEVKMITPADRERMVAELMAETYGDDDAPGEEGDFDAYDEISEQYETEDDVPLIQMDGVRKRTAKANRS